MYLYKYKLFENVKKAKEYLASKNIDEKDEDFLKIRELLKKTPNLIYNFVRYNKEENIPFSSDDNSYQSSLSNFYNYYAHNKQRLKNYLPQDIIDYDDFETLIDDIERSKDDMRIDDFLRNLYPVLRNQIDKTDRKTRNVILSFLNLPKEKQEQLPPLKRYKGDDVIELLNMMNNIVGEKNDKKVILKTIEKYGDDVEIVYNKNNVLLVRTFNKKAICEFGATKWCIVNNQERYYDTYNNPMKGYTQYILFNFNLPDTDEDSLFGITIDKDGSVKSGGLQNRLNNETSFDHIFDSILLPKNKRKDWENNVFVSHKYSDGVIRKYFTTEEIIETSYGNILTDKELYSLDWKYKLENNHAGDGLELHDFFTNDDKESLLKMDVVEKLSQFQDSSFFREYINYFISDEDLYSLPTRYKLRQPMPNTTLNKDMHHYFTQEQKEELRKFDPIKKLETFSIYLINKERLFDQDEIYDIDLRYRLENNEKVRGSWNDRKHNIKLHDFITSEEAETIKLDDKIEFEYPITDLEKSNLKLYQEINLYYEPNTHYADDDYTEYWDLLKRIVSAPLKEIVMVIGKSHWGVDEIYSYLDDVDGTDLGGKLKSDFYDDLKMVENIMVGFTMEGEEYYRDVVGFTDEDYHLREIWRLDNEDLDDIKDETENHLNYYLSDESKDIIRKIMDIVNGGHFDDKGEDMVENGEKIFNFFTINKSVLKYDTIYGKENDLDLFDYVRGFDVLKIEKIKDTYYKMEEMFPFEYESKGNVENEYEIKLDLEKVCIMLEDKEFENFDELMEELPDFDDMDTYYNASVKKHNNGLSVDSIERKEEVDSSNLERYNISVDETEKEKLEKEFDKTLASVLEKLKEGLDYVDASGDDEKFDYDNPKLVKIQKYNTLIKSLGFDSNAKSRKNDITLEILDNNIEEETVKIRRFSHEDYIETETGWVKWENLHTYFERGLFDNVSENRNLKRFKDF